ncbi:MAG: FAD-dependent oxidoreductase [Marinobacter sp.]
MSRTLPLDLTRRRFLKLSAGAGTAALLTSTGLHGQTIDTRAHVVIIGAGAGGMAIANRLSRQLRGGRITVVDARETHHYQPGWTLVASGVWAPDKTTRPNSQFMPPEVDWIRSSATEFDPDNRSVTLENGDTLNYDYLVVATGIQLNYGQIEGMSADLVGQHGIGSVYASLEGATRTRDLIDQWVQRGSGQGIFTHSPTPVKCAGAPLKMTFTTLSRLEASGQRDRFDVDFYAPGGGLFSQPWVNDFVKQRFDEQGVGRHHFHTLTAISPEDQQATFTRQDGTTVTREYDFIHVVPPMSAPDALRNSDLVTREGSFAGDWLDVDQYTLQHNRYPEVFGIGDVISAPINKTAASVKAQAPLVTENLLAAMQDKSLSGRHTGYTSCPLITGIGKAMLVEFGYDMEFLPSFPFIDPQEESWVTWTFKDKMLQPAYYAVLEGQA